MTLNERRIQFDALTPDQRQAIIEQFVDIIEGQRFTDWHDDEGPFGCYVTGDQYQGNAVTKKEIHNWVSRAIFRD